MKITLLPQSLFARLLTALLAAVGTALLIVVLLIVRERRELAFLGSNALSATSSIVEISTDLAQLDAPQRRAALENYRLSPPTLEDARPRRPPQRRPLQAEVERAFAERVRKQLGEGYSVRVSRGEPRSEEVIRLTAEPDRGRGPRSGLQPPPDRPSDARLPPPNGPSGAQFGPAGPNPRLLDVTVRLPDGQNIVFRTAAPQPGPPLPSQIFLELGVLTIALAVALYLMTRSVTRPLSDLARAADAIGRGGTYPTIPERGAKELRHATRAFNTMQDRLHRYLDSRTRVLSAMSHDLRTPLTRMRLRAEGIEDVETRDRFIADLDEMSEMVRGALNMFKGLTEAEPLEQVSVDALLRTLQTEYQEMGEHFAIEGQSSGPISARPRALKRCISNLLHNAIKYGGGAQVSVQDGAALSICVRDHGPGIPATELEKVFEPFYRLESSRSRDTGGTGLGLSIARDIAQAHGGNITLRNHPQGGLEAELTLPRG